MNFAVKEIDVSDIPDRGAWMNASPRADWAYELLYEFINSDANIWEVCEGLDGKFKTTKEASKYRSSIDAQIKKKEFNNIQVLTRGRRIFISKIRIV